MRGAYFKRHMYLHKTRATHHGRLLPHTATDDDEVSSLRDFVAGTNAGIALTLSGHPFDTIKVRLQTSDPGRFASGMHCLRETVSKEGLLGVFKGMGSPMATIPLLNAIVFSCYGQASGWIKAARNGADDKGANSGGGGGGGGGGGSGGGGDGDAHKKSDDFVITPLEASVAGMYAGVVNCAVCTPVELIKTQLQVQYGSVQAGTAQFNGPLSCAQKIVQAHGLRGLFRGKWRERVAFYCDVMSILLL
jgi:solute carrier family 25 carnitine/acylcarnitine transporter 20/29